MIELSEVEEMMNDFMENCGMSIDDAAVSTNNLYEFEYEDMLSY